ncbi:hypothetical protein ABZ354_13920 [Streptomyces sp. NPDC005925]|uniref:hypothetical protein n=1 Tax=Streptomyces sp. NPDC005925 TaxID=3157172 RepID=UPI0033F76C5B
MTSATVRGLAAAAALSALLVTAACGGGGITGQEPSESAGTTRADGNESTPGTDESTSGTKDGHGEIFPGSKTEEPSASAITLPRTKVGETATGSVEIPREKAGQTIQRIAIEIEGETVPSDGRCVGEAGSGGCTETFQYTPKRPGSYTGQLTATMADGRTVTAPIYGEAAEPSDSTSASTPPTWTSSSAQTSDGPDTGESTPDVPETEETTPEVPSDIPSPEVSDLP